jgi:general secretion pathway protein A
VKDYTDLLNAYLLAQHAAGRNSVLIIDEAQNLSAEVLEQLRLLTNLETSERKLLQIILIGQPELRELLASPQLEQLAQRVVARFHLDALSPEETTHYIAHRLFVAGLTGAMPFDTQALAKVHAITRGVPRRINLLCDRALLGAYAQGRNRVDAGLVSLAAAEAFGEEHAAAGRPWGRIGALVGAIVGAAVGAVGTYAWVPKPATEPAAAMAAAPSVAPGPAASAASAPPSAASATALPEAAPAATAAAASSPTLATPQATPARVLRADAWPHPIVDEANAWRQLAGAWRLPPPVGDPCVAARLAQVQCYRTRLSPAKVQLLDRPGIVTLRLGQGPALYAVLESLDHQQATLRMGDERVSVSALALAEHWQGEFGTYWRAPAGYEQLLRPGASGPVVDWLAASLARWQGTTPPMPGSARVDEALKAQITAFQQSQGLIADGAAGPFTLMQLNRVVGLDEPRLAKPLTTSSR